MVNNFIFIIASQGSYYNLHFTGDEIKAWRYRMSSEIMSLESASSGRSPPMCSRRRNEYSQAKVSKAG